MSAATGRTAIGFSTLRAERLLLRQILKKVSRSFYLSLIVLPWRVRKQVSLAYLFCRAADTIADTRLLPPAERLRALDVFRRQFFLDVPAFAEIGCLCAKLLPHQGGEGEQQLLYHIADCFHLLRRLSDTDQQLIRELVGTLTRGMEMDLTLFPDETVGSVRPLPDLAALDLYTYYVAGVVGEFWTKIHATHLPALRRRELPSLCALGVHFGKGLQLTNVLKDLGRDLHNGRCYLPRTHLRALHITVQELLQPATLAKLRPLLGAFIWYTLEHLDCARDYILRLPRHPMCLRLSCMWPLLFALQTLAVIYDSDALLQPHARVRISRQAVYRTMLYSCVCLVSSRFFTWYYTRLRKHLTGLLEPHPSLLDLV